MKPNDTDLRHARLLWDYLRLDVPVAPADCLLVFGGHDLGVARRAADLYRSGIAPLIVVSGGSRAVPDGSDSPTEADAIADVLLRRDVPKDAIALERLASYTSENWRPSSTRTWRAGSRPSGSCRGWPGRRCGWILTPPPASSTRRPGPGDPVPAEMLDAARALQTAGFNSRALS